jgi:hypothetical protein
MDTFRLGAGEAGSINRWGPQGWGDQASCNCSIRIYCFLPFSCRATDARYGTVIWNWVAVNILRDWDANSTKNYHLHKYQFHSVHALPQFFIAYLSCYLTSTKHAARCLYCSSDMILFASDWRTSYSRYLPPLTWRRKQIQFPKSCFLAIKIPSTEQSSETHRFLVGWIGSK